jgi:hypothetical protein
VRFAVAIGVIAVAWAAAIFIHQRHTLSTPRPVSGSYGTPLGVRQHPSGEDPVAVLLAIGGVAVAVAIIVPYFSRVSS